MIPDNLKRAAGSDQVPHHRVGVVMGTLRMHLGCHNIEHIPEEPLQVGPIPY